MTNVPALVPLGAASGLALPASLRKYLEVNGNDVDALAGGISSGFAVVSVRGKVWRARYQGNEEIIRDAEGEPRRKLQVIMVLVPNNISRTFYAGAYVPGSTEAPDCFSNDGIAPDASVQEPQSRTCATCPMSQFGSKITESGAKGKACQEHKRIAVVPADDIENAALGGPMLLRVPPTSLQELAKAQVTLRKNGNLPYYAVVTNIGFNPEVEYPMLTFNPVAVVQDEKMLETIFMHREGPVAESICYGAAGLGDGLLLPAARATPAPVRRTAPAAPAAQTDEPAPAAKPAATRRTKPAAAPAPEPEPTPVEAMDEDDGEPVAVAPRASTRAEPVIDSATERSLDDLLAGLN